MGNNQPKQEERLLTYAEVCDVLQTSQATLRRYVRDGRCNPMAATAHTWRKNRQNPSNYFPPNKTKLF